MKEWILTSTGKRFYPIDPRPQDVDIRDIARGLSNLCRFTGQVTRFYSVAQHSLHVSTLVPDRLALHGLMHDASEAYLNDISRPVKYSGPMAGYRLIEAGVQDVIMQHFNLPLLSEEDEALVKAADDKALEIEKYNFKAYDPDWNPKTEKQPYIDPWDPDQAERIFMYFFKLYQKAGR